MLLQLFLVEFFVMYYLKKKPKRGNGKQKSYLKRILFWLYSQVLKHQEMPDIQTAYCLLYVMRQDT